ncbi:MAG: DEAD/DEAH box helicase [Spirulina sp. SIO3F2]|nr:DEAD/DEAH box helicase [Spirulina sp. SIO3F2]
MHILHGTWIPDAETTFLQAGRFYLWAETLPRKPSRPQSQRYSGHLAAQDLAALLSQELGVKLQGSHRDNPLVEQITPCYFLLPTVAQQPLPSLELSRYLEAELPDTFDWQYWEVDCYPAQTIAKVTSDRKDWVNCVVPLLNDLHFLALHRLTDVQIGEDLHFWFHFTQALKRLIHKDQYIPALKYRELAASKTKRKSSQAKTKFEIYPGWELIGEDYETTLAQYLDYMPLNCAAGFAQPPKTPELYDRAQLLRHFSDCLLSDLLTQTYLPQATLKKLDSSFLSRCLDPALSPWPPSIQLEQYQQWQGWRERIIRTQTQQPFYLYFHLQDPTKPEDAWQLQFQVAPKYDPSLRVALVDYWRMRPEQQAQVKATLGGEFEQNLLLNLGYAARIYDHLWRGLETNQPTGIPLALDAALTFLKESAWILENAGYKVIVPAWWTPQGRQRAKVKLKAKSQSPGSSDASKSYFSIDQLVQYQYSLAIGNESVTEREWNQLVNAKVPLVQFRGQWIELDQDKMQQMLTFWQQQQQENPELSLLDFIKLTAQSDTEELDIECDRHDALGEMLAKLGDKSQLQPVDDPAAFVGTLRGYQKRGVSWLQYLEQTGLNGCLADDMGLGKTVQVIARLVQEQERAEAHPSKPVPPTLLIAPTSVLGNWLREIAKFAPQMKATVHHGSDRTKVTKAFKALCREHDVVITSFGLARQDAKLFQGIQWHRIVLDEAQNIKNPKAALTKAILKLPANHRLALTGTPIENRLMDLWSIFNFLNPGYLGTQAQFRRSFELAIQKHNNRRQSLTLKKLVEPFILRRVKTDASIIKDLPDKVEQKLFCNLTKEQASLYEVVVKEVTGQLEEVDGIKRKGLILATLTKLKQICNHPRQFLQDDSDFTAARSHKLTRLTEMVEEVKAEGESLLIFTQFTELGAALEKYLRQTCHLNTYYLHGGTARKKREAMIAAFQDPETEPSVFVLSLKAGGVGITLTKANHVFHFDRWWNPAVEDQATDRAFRIGQKKNVFVHKFVAIGTLEERIDEMIEDKKKLAGSIVGSDESWLTELDNEAFRSLIALNKTAMLD